MSGSGAASQGCVEEAAGVARPSTGARSSSHKRRRSRDAAATRRRLLESAEQAFAMHGYQGARLREIARRASVQPALIHHYFGDKQGLYQAMLEAALGESATLSWEILQADLELPTLVVRFVDMLLSYNNKHKNLAMILRRETQAGSPVTALTRKLTEESMVPLLRALEARLVERQRLGELRADADPGELMMTGLALCVYPFAESGIMELCFAHARVHDDASLARRREAIVDVLMRYVGRPG